MMADSNITKRALAQALQELMEEVPFDKINVTQICEKCGINRKSFYYHFKDKYDLANWIFDTEFISFSLAFSDVTNFDERLDLLNDICDYFYRNRIFYRKVLKIKGQNSFSEHLREYCRPLLSLRLTYLFGKDAADDFTINFFTDAALCCMERWIMEKDCMPPDQFVAKLKSLILNGADAGHREVEQ